MFPVGKIAKKNSLKECVFLLIRHSAKYSAILSKIHFYRLLFGDFSHSITSIPHCKCIHFQASTINVF